MGYQSWDNGKRNVLSAQISNPMGYWVRSAGRTLWDNIFSEISGVEVGTDGHNDRLKRRPPLVVLGIEDGKYVRRYMRIFDDSHVDRWRDGRARWKSHLGNVEFATEEVKGLVIWRQGAPRCRHQARRMHLLVVVKR